MTWGEVERRFSDTLGRRFGKPHDGFRREDFLKEQGIDVPIGPDTTVTLAQFLRLAVVARAVCLIRSQVATGTGFLIGADVVMTNNHVFTRRQAIRAEPQHARGCVAIFDYDNDPFNEASVDVRELDPDSGFVSSTGLDYAICRVKGLPDASRPREPLSLGSAVELAKGDDVFIVQHPGGMAKRVGQSGNQVTYADGRLLQYTTDTGSGSSGAPALDYLWRLAGLHHAHQPLQEAGKTYYRNEGYTIEAIRTDFGSNGPIARMLSV